MKLYDFREIWCADFEFNQPGDLPDPVCLVATEIRTGRWLRFSKVTYQRPRPFWAVILSSSLSPRRRSCFAISRWVGTYLAMSLIALPSFETVQTPLISLISEPTYSLRLHTFISRTPRARKRRCANSPSAAAPWTGMRGLSITAVLRVGRGASADAASETLNKSCTGTSFRTRALYQSCRDDGEHWHSDRR